MAGLYLLSLMYSPPFRWDGQRTMFGCPIPEPEPVQRIDVVVDPLPGYEGLRVGSRVALHVGAHFTMNCLFLSYEPHTGPEGVGAHRIGPLLRRPDLERKDLHQGAGPRH